MKPPIFTATMNINPVVSMVVPVNVVAHLTDSSIPGARPVVLARSDFFTEDEAREYAKEQSFCHPEPNRFVIYNPDGTFLESWRCGKVFSPFAVA